MHPVCVDASFRHVSTDSATASAEIHAFDQLIDSGNYQPKRSPDFWTNRPKE